MKQRSPRVLGTVFVVAALSMFSLVSGCSLTRDKAQCAATAECRSAFGTGYVCAESGLCELAPANPSCTAQSPADLLTAPEKYKNYIVIGSLLRSEGKEGARHDAVKLAVEAANSYLIDQGEDHPGLEDLRFGLVQCDHDGDKEMVTGLAEYLVDVVQTPAIIGPASSSNTAEAFRRINLADSGEELRRVLFFSPSATSVALTELESQRPGMLWRTAPTDDGQGRLMGEYAVESGAPFLAFYEETPYGEGLFAELREATGDLCDDCGISFAGTSNDPLPLTRELARDSTLEALADVETVFFMGAQESHLLEMIDRLSTDVFADKILFLSDAAASADTVAAVAGENIDRVIGTRPRAAEEGEATRFFTSAYEGRYDESPLIHSFTAHAYDAAWMLLLAGIRARLEDEPVTAEVLAEGLRRLSNDDWSELSPPDAGDDASETCPLELADDSCPPLTLDATYLPEIISAFEDIGMLDVRGASGSLDYNLTTEELQNSADAFEFWYLDLASSDQVSIVGGTPGEN